MSASTIERFRKRYHRDSTLRMLTLANDGQLLYLSRELAKGFFIGRTFDTAQGAHVELLTIDTNLAGATADEIGGCSFVDLVAQDGRYQRWRLRTETTPQITNDRYVIELVAAFENRQIISGVIVYDPDAPTPETLPTFRRFEFVQPTPSAEWIINHNIGEKPEIQLFTVGNAKMNADIIHITVNQARVFFSVPMAGSARCI